MRWNDEQVLQSDHPTLRADAPGSSRPRSEPSGEGAVQVFRSVANDPEKLATVCQFAKVMDKVGDHLDAATEEQIRRSLSRLELVRNGLEPWPRSGGKLARCRCL